MNSVSSNADHFLKQVQSSEFEAEEEKAVEAVTDAFEGATSPVDIENFISMLPRKMKRKFNSRNSFSARFKASINKK